LSKLLTESQRRNRNDKKRLQDLAKSILQYKETGKRIVLQKEPTDAMDILARKHGINIYDFFVGTISPEEQDRRRKAYNAKQREVNEREALKNNGVYKGTGEQLKEKEQYKKEFFALSADEQWAAHKAKQLIRDITRGWTCPICKGIMPEVEDISEDDIVNYAQVRKGEDNKYLFLFHTDCYEPYLAGQYKRLAAKHRSVHQVNTSKELIENYTNWKKKGDKI